MRLLWGLFALALFALEDGYVDPAECRTCHRAIFDSYQMSGMARTFHRPTSVPRLASFRHEASNRTYSVVEREGTYLLRRTTPLAAGTIENRIHFAIGSGNHSKTYVHQDAQGRLRELPLSWYAEDGGYWNMSPGYDKPDHSDFRRDVGDNCLFCHNGYPSKANSGLAMGIDCQRCHGPGEQHVRSRGRIVNPAKLTRDRQLDVCLQCHLESASRSLPDAVRRLDRTIFSYRPGEPLSAYKLFFDFAGKRSGTDRITVNGAGYGLLQSRCFQKSAAMTCTTYHNPHAATTEPARYTAVCRSCHPSTHGLKQASCADCHMQKRRTEDAVHVVMTDHVIRRTPLNGNLTAPLTEQHDRVSGPINSLYPARLPDTSEARLYAALAQIAVSSDLTRDTERLRTAISETRTTSPEPYIALGRSLQKLGRKPDAIRALQAALDRDAKNVTAAIVLSDLLLASDRPEDALVVLEGASKRTPADPSVLNSLSVAYARAGRDSDALRAASEALRADAEDPVAWLNFGVCLHAKGDRQGAEAAYRQAILLQPDLVRAHENLRLLLKTQ